MIGFIRGVLAHKEPPLLLVDVNGVGYELEVPMSTLFRLPAIGAEVLLRTHLVTRDDHQTLFGFATEDERRLFRGLIKVSGVGAKLALTILSGISVESFVQCVQMDDKASLVRLPGIGRKTAERLIIDMRDRIDQMTSGAGAQVEAEGVNGAGEMPSGGSSPRTEAYNALVTLGYKPGEVQKMLGRVSIEDQTTEDILRLVLKSVAP
jgi:Holliday junction DNA helicase RuvA